MSASGCPVPIVILKMLKGRTAEQKKQLVQEITEVVVRVAKTAPSEVDVLIEEHDPWLWAKAGEFLAERIPLTTTDNESLPAPESSPIPR